MKKGIYDSIINEELQEQLNNLDESLVKKSEKIDTANAHITLADYIKNVTEKGLSHIKGADSLEKQIDLVNKLVSVITSDIDDREFDVNRVVEDEVLKRVERKQEKNAVTPVTSISQSSLFTGNTSEPTVYSELKKEILTADRIDLLISFIKMSGLRLIYNELVEFTKSKPLRVVTTSYMGATDYKAIKMLSELPNTKIKVSYDTKRTRLHAKAYYFHRDTGFSTAYIGSSNLSKSALSEGTEWNMKVSEYTSKQIIDKYEATFERYWNTDEFRYFDPNNQKDHQHLRQSLKKEIHLDDSFYFDVKPYTYQQEILDKLEVEREYFHSYKNLLVAATGMGKTVVTAFDYKRFAKRNPNAKLLFIAHREEILKQSMSTFRGILRDQNFGELWTGKDKPSSYHHVFASVYTLDNVNLEETIDRDYFDYIVIDETHHGAAKSYKKILEYFKPQILLGLTATPERMDGLDILEYFNNRIAYEVRLHEAIERNLLSPFHYFAISDNVDLGSVTWENGKYKVSELDKLYTGNHARCNNVVNAIERYTNDISDIKGLGFCVNQNHARFMADEFKAKGIPSLCLDANSSREDRNVAKSLLEKGDIKFIFVVDLYNEGVDIPCINTVLFLRPTESSTVFIQQLGRGLRLDDDKEVLTVLDFVGHAHKKFDYARKLRCLMGRTHTSIKDEVEKGFPTMPKGCFIQLEKVAKEHILENLKNVIVNKRALIAKAQLFELESNKPFSVSNFLNHYHIEAWQLYKVDALYYLKDKISYLSRNSDFTNDNFRKKVYYRLKDIRSIEFIDFVVAFAKDEITIQTSRDTSLLRMLYFTIFDQASDQKFDVLRKLFDNNDDFRMEMIEIMAFNKSQVNHIERDVDLDRDIALSLNGLYTTRQALASFNALKDNTILSFREGVKYVKEKHLDIFFITLNKSDKDYSETTLYEDYFISDSLFHWQSQSRTSVTDNTGQRYINQRTNKSRVLLFVRDHKNQHGKTAPYRFIGLSDYVSHKGSKPISITYKLRESLTAEFIMDSKELSHIG